MSFLTTDGRGLDLGPSAAWLVDAESGRIVWSSDGIWDIAGIAPSDDPEDWLAGMDGDNLAAVRALSPGQGPIRVCLATPDGSARCLEAEAVGVLDTGPAPVAVVVARDITDALREVTRRRAAEQALSSLRQRLITADPERVADVLSDALAEMCRHLGVDSIDVHLVAIDGALPPALGDWIDEASRLEVLAGRSVVVAHPEEEGLVALSPGLMSDRLRVVVEARARHAHWTDGDRWLLVRFASIVDLALRLGESERLQEVWRARTLAFARQSSDVLFIYSPDMVPIYASPAYEEIFGRNVEEWAHGGYGRDLQSVHPEDVAAVESDMAAFLARVAGSPPGVDPPLRLDLTYRVLRPDGRRRWVRSRVFPIYAASGEILGIGGIGSDVTEERALFGEVVSARDAAEDRVGRMSRLMSRALAEWEAAALRSGDAVQRELASTLVDLVEVDRQPLEPSVVDLHRLTRSLVVHARVSHGVDIDCELATADPVIIDERLLEALVSRLVDFAASRLDECLRLRVAIKPGQAGLDLVVRVSGRGPGLPVEALSRMVIPLERLGPDDRPVDRLALAIADACVRRLGGALDLHTSGAGAGMDGAPRTALTITARIPVPRTGPRDSAGDEEGARMGP